MQDLTIVFDLDGTLVETAPDLIRATNHVLGLAGLAPVDSLLDAARSRLRPIMMTTLTTLFGLFPLVFLPREGTELYRGLGIVLLFGLLISTLVTLSFTPCLLRLLRRGGAQTPSPA